MTQLNQLVLPKRVPWDEFIETVDWEQGEHASLISPTGGGKSTLSRALCWRRDWVVQFCTKKSDSTYQDSITQGYRRIKTWPPPKPHFYNGVPDTPYGRFLLWPEYKKLNDIPAAAPLFRKTLGNIFIDEGWTIVLDDLFYLSQKLKLANEISAINYQVRSMGVTLIAAMQRPKKVPLECWDQCSHAFLSRIGNYDDLMTIKGLSQVDGNTLRNWMQELRAYEWLYLPVAKSMDYEPVIVKPPMTKFVPKLKPYKKASK